MRKTRLVALVTVLAMVVAACGGDDAADETTTTAAPAATTTTEAPATTAGDTTTTEAEPTGLTCDEPITVGLITDQTGALAIYGAHILRGVPIGFQYATGDDGTDGTYTLENCDINLVIKDDQSNPELSATAGSRTHRGRWCRHSDRDGFVGGHCDPPGDRS